MTTAIEGTVEEMTTGKVCDVLDPANIVKPPAGWKADEAFVCAVCGAPVVGPVHLTGGEEKGKMYVYCAEHCTAERHLT